MMLGGGDGGGGLERAVESVTLSRSRGLVADAGATTVLM